MSNDQLDLLIIGAGPAGLSAADTAAREGLRYLVVEKGLIADTIYHYPIGLTVFSTPHELEMREGALQPCREKPTREELLSHYVQFALERSLLINTEEEVTGVERNGAGGFLVQTSRAHYSAARLLAAFGVMARPRRLNVAGGAPPKNHPRVTDPLPSVCQEALRVCWCDSAAAAQRLFSHMWS